MTFSIHQMVNNTHERLLKSTHTHTLTESDFQIQINFIL